MPGFLVGENSPSKGRGEVEEKKTFTDYLLNGCHGRYPYPTEWVTQRMSCKVGILVPFL